MYLYQNSVLPKEHRMKRQTEIETYLLDEIDVRETMVKKMKQFNKINNIVDTDLITSTTITGQVSIVTSVSIVGLRISIALSETSVTFSLAKAIAKQSFKIFTIKQEKHDEIKASTESKLDSIANIISQTVQDRDISSVKFHQVEKRKKYISNLRVILDTEVKLR